SGPLDLNDTSYVPRPEWYFLAHYELLRFTPGPLKLLTTFVLPTLVVAVLVVLPWLDRAPSSAVRARKTVVGGALFAASAIIGLTLFGVLNAPESTAGEDVDVAESSSESGEEAELAAGRRAFQQLRCYDCHRIGPRGRTLGPDLTHVGSRLQEPYLRAWL